MNIAQLNKQNSKLIKAESLFNINKERISDEIKNYEKIVNELKLQIHNFKTENSQLKTEKDNYENNIKDIKAKYEHLKSSYTNINEKHDHLVIKGKQNEIKINELTKDLNDSNKKNLELSFQISQLQNPKL